MLRPSEILKAAGERYQALNKQCVPITCGLHSRQVVAAIEVLCTAINDEAYIRAAPQAAEAEEVVSRKSAYYSDLCKCGHARHAHRTVHRNRKMRLVRGCRFLDCGCTRFRTIPTRGVREVWA